MRTETALNSASNHSILSVEARTRARLSNARKQKNNSFRTNRRQTIHGALDGILGDSSGDDWSLDGESFCSGNSRQSFPAASKTRYARRGSVTKFSLDPVAISTDVPTSVEAKNNRNEHDDDISLCSQLSEDNSQKSGARRRYARRGSVTKYSLEPAIAAATETDKHLSHQSEHDDTSSVHSGTSHSSFPEIPAQCTTIDNLPIPMKTKRKSNIKKSRDSISKYSEHSMKEDILAASMHKKDSDKKDSDKKKKRSSKLKKPDKTSLDNTPDSPDTTKAKKSSTTTKKKKKELKLRKDKHPEDEAASVSSNAAKSEASSKRRQKRRCSVTKYNLTKEVENQMDSSFSGPIPLPVVEPSPTEEATETLPASPPSSPKRHHRRRTSVTAYTPGIMEAAGKSPGTLSKRPSIGTTTTTTTVKNEDTTIKKSPGVHRRRNSITKYSLEQSKPQNFPAAA